MAEARKAVEEETGTKALCGVCGGRMSCNPHPEAGKPDKLLTIGAMYECIPCQVKSRHKWAERATKAEEQLAERLDRPELREKLIELRLEVYGAQLTEKDINCILALIPDERKKIAEEIKREVEGAMGWKMDVYKKEGLVVISFLWKVWDKFWKGYIG